MTDRTEVVAFDVVGTLFSLEALRGRLIAAGMPGHALETWFAQLLRNAFALDATGVYKSFTEVAAATLESLLSQYAPEADNTNIGSIMAGFAELDADPDAASALRALRDAGIRVVTLTNGSASNTEKLLERAGLRDLVERIVSIDEVRRWKPHRDVYAHCASAVGVPTERLGLIAVHAWDIHGASRAGLITGYVSHGKGFPSIMNPPDVMGGTLREVVERLAAARRS